jgi:chromosome segregation ATPase
MLFNSHVLIFILFLFVGTIEIYSQGSIDRPQPLEVPQGESKDEKPEDLNASFFYWVGEYKKLATYKKETDKKILDLINKYNTDISLLLNENKLLEQVIYEKEKTIKDFKIQSEKDRETIERLEAELRALRGAKEKAERLFSDTSIQMDSKLKEIESKNKEIIELKKTIETKTQTEKQLTEKVTKSEDNLAKTQAELKSLQKQVEDAQKALQTEKASSEKAKEDLKSLQSQTGELQKTILSQKETLAKNKTELDELKLSIKNLEAKNLEAQNLLQMEKYKTEVLSKDLLESQKKSTDQQKQINELQKQLSNMQTLMQAEKLSYEKQIIDCGVSLHYPFCWGCT